mgnify:CR=1 FL=1
MPTPTTLPIWKIHSDILHELQDGNRLLLVAPTGSGKTTQVGQHLETQQRTKSPYCVVLWLGLPIS